MGGVNDVVDGRHSVESYSTTAYGMDEEQDDNYTKEAWNTRLRLFVVWSITSDGAALATRLIYTPKDCVRLSLSPFTSAAKKWCAFQILMFLVDNRRELYSVDETEEDRENLLRRFPKRTRERMKVWKRYLGISVCY